MWQFFVAFSCRQMKFGVLLLSPLFFQQSMLTFIERTKRACFGSPEEVRDYLIDPMWHLPISDCISDKVRSTSNPKLVKA